MVCKNLLSRGVVSCQLSVFMLMMLLAASCGRAVADEKVYQFSREVIASELLGEDETFALSDPDRYGLPMRLMGVRIIGANAYISDMVTSDMFVFGEYGYQVFAKASVGEGPEDVTDNSVPIGWCGSFGRVVFESPSKVVVYDDEGQYESMVTLAGRSQYVLLHEMSDNAVGVSLVTKGSPRVGVVSSSYLTTVSCVGEVLSDIKLSEVSIPPMGQGSFNERQFDVLPFVAVGKNAVYVMADRYSAKFDAYGPDLKILWSIRANREPVKVDDGVVAKRKLELPPYIEVNDMLPLVDEMWSAPGTGLWVKYSGDVLYTWYDEEGGQRGLVDISSHENGTGVLRYIENGMMLQISERGGGATQVELSRLVMQ
jgi:hypothetical protein